MDGDRAALWIHGHMHESYDYEIYGTRIACNPRGYAPEALNLDFRPDWVVALWVTHGVLHMVPCLYDNPYILFLFDSAYILTLFGVAYITYLYEESYK